MLWLFSHNSMTQSVYFLNRLYSACAPLAVLYTQCTMIHVWYKAMTCLSPVPCVFYPSSDRSFCWTRNLSSSCGEDAEICRSIWYLSSSEMALDWSQECSLAQLLLKKGLKKILEKTDWRLIIVHGSLSMSSAVDVLNSGLWLIKSYSVHLQTDKNTSAKMATKTTVLYIMGRR